MESVQRRQLITHWKEGSRVSLQLAHDVFAKKYYDHALFCGHLALEKLLKALVVEAINDHAPHSHDLLYLAGLARIDLDVAQQQQLTAMNAFNVEGRYHEEKLEFHRRVTKAFAREWLMKITKLHVWLSKHLEKN